MQILIVSAIPVFLLTIALEVLVLHRAVDAEQRYVGYDLRDSRTSIALGTVHLGINAVWKLAAVTLYAGLYTLSPVHLPLQAWWSWVLLLLADDLCYYAYHRSHHRVRLFWATHVVHHSSEHYNLSTALRQDWSPFSHTLFWIPVAFLVPPWALLLAITWNLLYQFWIHTEAIDKLWAPLEFVINTPSHHRVHHGSQSQYLDRNYAGIFILWDRLFDTFEPEGERVRYGLTNNVQTHHLLTLAYGEFAAIWRDVRRAPCWADRAGYAFGAPGWRPVLPSQSGPATSTSITSSTRSSTSMASR